MRFLLQLISLPARRSLSHVYRARARVTLMSFSPPLFPYLPILSNLPRLSINPQTTTHKLPILILSQIVKVLNKIFSCV